MIFLIVFSFGLLGILLGKYIFKKWFNHLSIYCFIWSCLIIFYNLRLLPYVEIIPLAWIFIFLSFLSFLLGILTSISMRNLNSNQQIERNTDVSLDIFKDGGKIVKYSIILFSFICLLAAIQNWMVLIKMYGSIPGVILNLTNIYNKTIHGEIKGIIPYISFLGYVAVFFSGLYTAYNKKFTLLTFFPFIGITIKEFATTGRVGILFALLEFLFTFFLFRNLLKNDLLQRYKFNKRNGIIAFSIIIIFFITFISIARITRGTGESFANKSVQLKNLKNNYIKFLC